MAGARILVIKRDNIRQFVEYEPAFAAIRDGNPGVPIDLLTGADLGRIAKGAPHFDRVLAVGTMEEKDAFKSLVQQLRRIGYEQVFDLDGSRLSLDLRSGLTGFRGPRWVGPKRILGRGSAMSADGVRRLLTEARLDVEERLPELGWAMGGRKESANMQPSWFGISGAFALFVPADDPAIRWPEAAFAEVAQALYHDGMTSVVVGSDHLAPFAQGIVQRAIPDGPGGAGRVVDLTGKADLAQLAMMARHAEFFVSGPSDLVHLMAALGCPGVLMTRGGGGGSGAEGLFGREVVRLLASETASVEPSMVIGMLGNMGLLGAGEPARGRRP